MKENSIEKDIAITKKLITTKFNNDYSIDNKDKEAIEHILTDYKKILKENEELKNNTRKNEQNSLEFDVDGDWAELKKILNKSRKTNEYIMYNGEKWIKEKYCIPIQKLKEIIEELDIEISECEYLDDDDEKYKKAVEKDKLCLLNQKRVLKRLLESEE